MSFLKILKSSVQFSNLCPFSNSQIAVQFLNLWPFLKSTSNDVTDICPNPKSAIDLRIWKGRPFENTLKSDLDLR